MRKPNARERILTTAAQLFHQRGYSEVGINEIIEKAETAKASFYSHFPSKEALCEAWLETAHERSENHQREILDAEGTPLSKIEQYLDELVEFLVKSEFRGCPYSNTKAVTDKGCEGIIEQIRSHKEANRSFFLGICQQQFGDTEEAQHAADQVFLLYSGAATESQNFQEIWPVEIARHSIRNLFGN